MLTSSKFLADDVPVHHRLGASGRRIVSDDIGAADGQRAAEDDSENQTHWNSPAVPAASRVGQERGAIVFAPRAVGERTTLSVSGPARGRSVGRGALDNVPWHHLGIGRDCSAVPSAGACRP